MSYFKDHNCNKSDYKNSNDYEHYVEEYEDEYERKKLDRSEKQTYEH